MPTQLLRQNSELRADGIFNWTLPAFAVTLTDGTNMNVCPNAGACATVCYARNGTYLFSNVRGAHMRNLEWVKNDLIGWKLALIEELRHKRYLPTGQHARFYPLLDLTNFNDWLKNWANNGGKAIRIHDSGDFFTREYFEAWIDVAQKNNHLLFYAYTKEVAMTKEFGALPNNFILIYSMGGKQDHLIDTEVDRHAEVFPTIEELVEAGYTDQEDSDILAALMPSNKVGIVANNIAHFKKKMAGKTFGGMQHDRDEKRSAKLANA